MIMIPFFVHFPSPSGGLLNTEEGLLFIVIKILHLFLNNDDDNDNDDDDDDYDDNDNDNDDNNHFI